MHTHLVATAAWRWKNQKAPVDGLLKRVATEDLVLVSTGGADWLLGSGKATKVDGGYRVTGRKIFCSGAPAGGLMMTTAVIDDPADGPTVLQIAVPTNAQGVKIENDWKALGMRGTGSHDISFDDVFVPDAAVALRRPSGKWHPLIHVVAMVALPVFNAVYVGVAEAARGLAIEAARRRSDDRVVQAHAGEMENELTSAQLALGRMIDIAMTQKPGVETTVEIMCCRAILGRGARATVDKAMDLAGGGSFLRKNAARALVPGCPGRPLPPAAGEAAECARGTFQLRIAARRLSHATYRSSLVIAGIATVSTTWLRAQDPPTPTFRAGTTLIEFTLVARDSQGNPIADLTKDDIVVTENGQPREVEFFRFDGAPPQPSPNVHSRRVISRTDSRPHRTPRAISQRCSWTR